MWHAMRRRVIRLLHVLLGVLIGASCGGSDSVAPGQDLVARVDYGPVGTLVVGDTTRPRLFDASSREVFATAWSSSDPTVASVGTTGLVTGVRSGTTMIRLSAGARTASVQVVVGGTLHAGAIRASESWTTANGPHVVDSVVAVGGSGGVVLTLGPGVTVFFKKPGAALLFGDAGAGTLVADGSAGPIILRAWSDTAAAGTWQSLTFRGAGRSVLTNVTLRSCGRTTGVPGGVSDPPASGCILLLDTALAPAAPEILLDNVMIADGRNAAIVLEGRSRFAAGSRRFSLNRMRGHVGRMRAGLAGDFPAGGSFIDVDSNEVRLTGDTLGASAAWPHQGFAYHLLAPVVVQGNAIPQLTIAAGASLRFAPGAAIVVGRDAAGSLQVGALASDRVTMDADGNGWVGVQFWSHAVHSAITNTTIRACGVYVLPIFGAGCILFIGNSATPGPSPVLNDVTIDSAGYVGVALTRGGRFGPGSGNLTITRTRGVPLQAEIDVLPSIPTGTYVGNVIDQIRIIGANVTTSMTLRNLGVPYGVAEGLAVEGSANPMLSIESGTELRMGVGSYVRVGVDAPGGIRATGTTAAPVRFVAYGPNGHPGWWMRLLVGTLADPNSLLDHVLVENAGAEDRGAAAVEFLRDLGPVLRNSTLRLSAGCGVLRNGSPWHTDFTAPALGNQFEQLAGAPVCGP